jgi:pimeloyl-ACP methyl ester carboxylesterase
MSTAPKSSSVKQGGGCNLLLLHGFRLQATLSRPDSALADRFHIVAPDLRALTVGASHPSIRPYREIIDRLRGVVRRWRSCFDYGTDGFRLP